MLTPDDLKNVKFSKGFRGYEPAEVDKFVENLIKEFEYLYLDNIQQKETIERVTSKLEYYQQMESTMQSTLAVAQETADEVKAASEKKAELLIQETEVKCNASLSEAQAAAQKMESDARTAAEDLYNQTKIKTENMLSLANTECDRMREDARAYAENLKATTEVAVEKMRLNMEDLCKKRGDSAISEANALLENARNEANRMMLEANTKYRSLVADAEERSRKLIFDAESRASAAEASYQNQMRKASMQKKSMMQILENQMELLKKFGEEEQGGA